MRLSEWRASSPSKDAIGSKVTAVVDPVIRSLGAEPDPHCWVAWGEEPAIRYTIFVPTPAGLVAAYVRVNVPGEGPRATAKLIRWSRLQLGELSVETQRDHRLVTFQVEQQVLNGIDARADGIARFALELLAAVDGRVLPPEPVSKRRTAGKAATGRAAAAAKPGRPSAAKPGRPSAATAPRPQKAAPAPRARRSGSSG
jgi:hypothetical protein